MIIAAGKQDYEVFCASCHGESGKGAEGLAGIVHADAPDLTEIAKLNGGLFPFWKVYNTIEGSVPPEAHKDMPAFEKHLGGADGKNAALPIYVRILNLTHYLETIQQK